MTRRDLTAETAEDKFNVEAEARARGIEPYALRAANAVSDKLMADIVGDAYRGISQSASMIPERKDYSEPAPKGTGWVDVQPLKAPDVRWCDAQMDAQDRLDKVARIRAAQEAAWIESHYDKGPRIETEHNPFDAEHMKK